MQFGDTIIAVASPPGRSPRGLIRLSGPHAHSCIDSLPPGRLGILRLTLASADLPALFLRFDAPRSYTGEDVLELLLPGNPDLLEMIIDQFVSAGVRRAEAGEFTARAFFNERLSLSQAEGVAQTISARSDAELAAASQLLTGRLGDLCASLSDQVAELLALVEAGVDFTDEEDIVAIAPDVFLQRAERVHDVLQEHLAHAVGTEKLSAAPWAVLTGPANAGKSTLFNALLGRTRAVESAIAGATRDVLVEPLLLPCGGEIMLVDLAGVWASDVALCGIRSKAAEAREKALKRAELIIECLPINAQPPEDESHTRIEHVGIARLIVRTKCDLRHSGRSEADGGLLVSARSGAGLDALLSAIADALADRASSLAADAIALAPRQEQALRAAQRHLAGALHLVQRRAGHRDIGQDELVASELRSALNALGELVGEITPDDVLGRVFASFCIGK